MSGMCLIPSHPPIQSNPLTRYPSPSQSAPPPHPTMDKQEDIHFQKGSAKPTKFKNQTYENPCMHPPYFSHLLLQTAALGSIQVPRAIRVCPYLHFALCESIDRAKLIRAFSF